MIPVPIHFIDIDREAGVHPSVAAEIDAARHRAGAPVRAPRRDWAADLTRLLARLRKPRRREDWTLAPGE